MMEMKMDDGCWRYMLLMKMLRCVWICFRYICIYILEKRTRTSDVLVKAPPFLLLLLAGKVAGSSIGHGLLEEHVEGLILGHPGALLVHRGARSLGGCLSRRGRSRGGLVLLGGGLEERHG
jgi:hypothetical protein